MAAEVEAYKVTVLWSIFEDSAELIGAEAAGVQLFPFLKVEPRLFTPVETFMESERARCTLLKYRCYKTDLEA